MELAGMLDASCLRRMAVTPGMIDLPFAHRPISVLGARAEFHAVDPEPVTAATTGQDGVAVVVAWRFIRARMPDEIGASARPARAAHSQAAERLDALLATPSG